MIIYNPNSINILEKRIEEAGKLLSQISVKYCFITGSFLYKEKYKDIDVFVITRAKKKFRLNNKKVKITIMDFNELYSLFYHSIFKSCVAKDVLPMKPLKVTIADYWDVLNEAVPTLLNRKNKYHKDVRFLVLYTEYLKNGNVLDTFQLNQKIEDFDNYKQILDYIKKEIPKIIQGKIKKSYIKRFFYTQTGAYKDMLHYDAQKFLYNLAHRITRGLSHG